MHAIPEEYISLYEYFLLEERSETKHEYYNGEIFDMSGASARHNKIVMNVTGNLYQQLLGKTCDVYPSDLRLKIEATGLYTYPDAQVICGNLRYADKSKDTVTNPSVLIEVLSPSTEGYDRGKKYPHYRMIESLQEYLVIAQDSARVEHYLRLGEHRWQLLEFTQLDQVIPLASIECQLAMAAIYTKVDFEGD